MPDLSALADVIAGFIKQEPAMTAVRALVFLSLFLVVTYLILLDRRLVGIPDEVSELMPTRWTREMLTETYRRLQAQPITPSTYASRIPPKLERRYIVTGGSGLVGSAIVRQLLARGQPPSSIRIVDFRPPNPTSSPYHEEEVDFVQTDISSPTATRRAFTKPWPSAVSHLPLTVFHTAAVIVPSDRAASGPGLALCEAVNVRGTQNVVDSAREAGADVLVSTTSGSIALKPVGLWMNPWELVKGWVTGKKSWPKDFWQVLDESDFFAPLKKREEFYANYAASKARAERIVCAANSAEMRTGCVRPANGIYGDPRDNMLGGTLAKTVMPSWVYNIAQNYVHCENVAIAHLDFEAVLAASPSAALLPQAGRPFVVTDPNPPIQFNDLYQLVKTLAVTRFYVIRIPAVPILVMAYFIEGYMWARWQVAALAAPGSWLQRMLMLLLPEFPAEVKHVRPAIFSITTHLLASNGAASKSVSHGGIGYTGVWTTLEGMVQEVIDWNRAHIDARKEKKVVHYQRSVAVAEEIAKSTAATTVMSVASS